MYTAMTRTGDYKNIHIDKTEGTSKKGNTYYKSLEYKYYLPDYNNIKPINMNYKTKDKYIYKLTFDCDCQSKKKYYFDWSSNIKQLTPYLKNKYKEHKKCDYELELLMQKELSINRCKQIIYHLANKDCDSECTINKKATSKNTTKVFKYIKKTTKRPYLTLLNDRVRFVYYDDENKQVRKEMKTKRKGTDETLNDMKKYIEALEIDTKTIDVKNNLVLSFA
jgi:hypothetical protein